MHGSFEQRMKDLVAELEQNPDIILFLDEIHQLDQPGRTNGPGEILKPALARGLFRCIGATTTADYHRHIEHDPALARRFYSVHVSEPDEDATRKILASMKARLETHYHLTITEEALKDAVELSKSHIPHRRFPDKAIDVLDRACSTVCLTGGSLVDVAPVRHVVADLAGIAFTRDSAEFRDRLESLECDLKAAVLGQDAVIDAVANTVRLCKHRLDLRPNRPDGVFLFLGPTGVGKTELAKVMTQSLTGKMDHLIRIDMSEYSEAHTISRLIGSPPGYIGFHEEPQLVQGLRRSPQGVLLLDEFEKAHPQIHRLFLQIFDEGRFTDAQGGKHSLAHITVVATANIGARPAAASIGFGESPAGQGGGIPWDELQAVFPVELLNRFDEILVFNPLSREVVRRIITDCLIIQANRILAQQGAVPLQLTDADIDAILQRGYSHELGARNLARTFERMVMLPLAGKRAITT
jgi:ATP-dependent Clp protease ATP-binding subunit ClpA